MNTKNITAAIALALALGVAAPAFAGGGVDPSIAVERLTEELQDNQLETNIEPVTVESPEFG